MILAHVAVVRSIQNVVQKRTLDHRKRTSKMTLRIMTDTAKLHLNALPLRVDSAKKIVVKSVDMMNNVLVATFCPNSRDSMGIRIETSQIIAYLSGLFDVEDELGDFGITHFAAT